MDASSIRSGFKIALVLIETLSAPDFRSISISLRDFIPPPTVNGIKTCEAIDLTVSIVVERSSKDASISNMHISSAPSASYLLAASAGSPASTISLKLIPLTTLPPLTSKQGIIRTAKLIF